MQTLSRFLRTLNLPRPVLLLGPLNSPKMQPLSHFRLFHHHKIHPQLTLNSLSTLQKMQPLTHFWLSQGNTFDLKFSKNATPHTLSALPAPHKSPSTRPPLTLNSTKKQPLTHLWLFNLLVSKTRTSRQQTKPLSLFPPPKESASTRSLATSHGKLHPAASTNLRIHLYEDC